MSLWRSVLVGAAATTLLFACTLTRNLDYLQDGKKDAGTSSSGSSTSSSSTSSSTSSSSSSGAPGQAQGTPIATGQYAPASLVQDASNIYWTTADNQIMALAKSAPAGTAPKQLAKLDGQVQQVGQAVVDVAAAGNVYVWLDSGDVKSIPKAGGAAVQLFNIPAPATIEAIAADDTYLFVLVTSDPDGNSQSALYRYPKAGPYTATTLSTRGTSPTTMILTSDSVFWAVTDDNANLDNVVLQLPKTAAAGATATAYTNTLQDQGSPVGIIPDYQYDIVIDAQTFYWVDTGGDAAYFQPFAPPTGKATRLFAPSTASSNTINALTEDGTNVYLTLTTETDSTSLLRVPKGGGEAPTEIILAATNPTEVITDGPSLYIAYDGPGSTTLQGGILKLAK